MADPSLRNHLYSEAERTVQELLNRGVISQQGYNDIFRILSSERGNAQESSYGQPQPYQQYNQNWNQPVQGIPYNTQGQMVPATQQYMPPPQSLQNQQFMPTPQAMQTQQSLPPPQQSMPPPKQEVLPQNPPPEQHHSSSGLGKFGKRMGNNVANSMTHGFGFTIGSQAANSLWHKF